MPRVWISAGSNIDRETNIRAAIDELHALFGDLVISPIYETEAVGFAGDAFFNLVIGFYTELPPGTLHGLMRAIEARHGRQRSANGELASRTLDLDVLTYGNAVTDDGGKALPRDEILRYAFVLAPLADVAADERHPELGETYQALWQNFATQRGQDWRRIEDPDWL